MTTGHGLAGLHGADTLPIITGRKTCTIIILYMIADDLVPFFVIFAKLALSPTHFLPLSPSFNLSTLFMIIIILPFYCYLFTYLVPASIHRYTQPSPHTPFFEFFCLRNPPTPRQHRITQMIYIWESCAH